MVCAEKPQEASAFPGLHEPVEARKAAITQAWHHPEDITQEKIRCRNARFSRMCAQDTKSMAFAHA